MSKYLDTVQNKAQSIPKSELHQQKQKVRYKKYETSADQNYPIFKNSIIKSTLNSFYNSKSNNQHYKKQHKGCSFHQQKIEKQKNNLIKSPTQPNQPKFEKSKQQFSNSKYAFEEKGINKQSQNAFLVTKQRQRIKRIQQIYNNNPLMSTKQVKGYQISLQQRILGSSNVPIKKKQNIKISKKQQKNSNLNQSQFKFPEVNQKKVSTYQSQYIRKKNEQHERDRLKFEDKLKEIFKQSFANSNYSPKLFLQSTLNMSKPDISKQKNPYARKSIKRQKKR